MSPEAPFLQLLLFSAIAICNSLDVGDLQDILTLYRHNNLVGYETDMLTFLDQSHHFMKTKRNDDSIAVMRVANYQANLANIKHAIRVGAAEVAETILDSYSSKLNSDDLSEASVVLARLLVRAQVTTLDAISSLWERSLELIEQYREAKGMDELLEEIMERLGKDPFSLDEELQVQEDKLREIKFSDPLSELNFLKLADQIIDDAFNCAECSGLAQSDEWDNIAPLATKKTIDHWVTKYVDEHYLERVRKNGEHLANLMNQTIESFPETE